MATETNQKEKTAPAVKAESQQERWIKYGANVVLVTVVVILLAGIFTYLAQRTGQRIDTTASGAYSLKPQTINILRDIDGKTKIVSLYTEEIIEGGKSIKSPYAEPVIDLLDEYRRKGRNIEVEAIDPVQNPSKVDALIDEVTSRYGGEVKQYRAVLDAYARTAAQIKELATAEAGKIASLPLDALGESEDAQTARLAIETITGVPRELESTQQTIDRRTAQKPPDYRGAVDRIEDSMDRISRTAEQVIAIFKQFADDKQLPEPVRQYMAAAIPTYETLKKLADEQLAAAEKLGELKLDDLRQSLRARDAILVMGETDMRVIPFEQVWKADDQQLRNFVQGQELKPRFAGEQQISTALLALSQEKKPKVVFVRAGGPPLTTPGMLPFQRGGPMSQVAERLRQYNFEVLEKDLSGMWAMQAQMQQMPAAAEPSDEEIKDAIWIALAFPTGQQNPMMPGPTSIGPRVAEHLKGGGSAMTLFAPQVDNMADTLKEWGLEVHTNAVAVHEPIQTGEGRQLDAIEEALKYPFVFDIREYGDHMITRPLDSLPSFLVPILPVKPATTQPSGVKTTPIIPIPQQPRSWGETNIDALGAGEEIQFDAGVDVPQPIFGGAAAEKDGGGRLVVIASPMFAFDRYLNEPDIDMLRRGIIASRFPANAELFMNSAFWLAKMEPMIAISPAAMEVSRIEPMKPATLRLWRDGLLMIGLPMAVVLAGALVWFARRD